MFPGRNLLQTLQLYCVAFSQQICRYRQQLQGRLTFGTFISVAVEWGLMPLFAPPNPNYGISPEKAREKVRFIDPSRCVVALFQVLLIVQTAIPVQMKYLQVFLAVWNDKTWSTNVCVFQFVSVSTPLMPRCHVPLDHPFADLWESLNILPCPTLIS